MEVRPATNPAQKCMPKGTMGVLAEAKSTAARHFCLKEAAHAASTNPC
jgi:hypothetical protein